MKRAIITGATGAIGTALTKELTAQGIEVLIFTHEKSTRNKNILDHPLVKVKYCSLEQLALVDNDMGKSYDIFYHLAWSGSSGPNRHDMYMQNLNVKYALDAVRAAQKFGCHTFIGAGSQAEYGNAGCVLKAQTPVFPQMGYGYAKLCAGQMTRDYAAQLGIRHIWVRILSVYGPNDWAQSLVMSTVNKLKQGIIPGFTKGEQIWDYLYSKDAAKALYLLAQKGRSGKVYVLGSGRSRPLKEFVREIRDVVAPGAELAFGVVAYGKNQVMYLCADPSDLENDVGWKATTDFKDGIKEIVNTL